MFRSLFGALLIAVHNKWTFIISDHADCPAIFIVVQIGSTKNEVAQYATKSQF
jgi:hypothetical protein